MPLSKIERHQAYCEYRTEVPHTLVVKFKSQPLLCWSLQRQVIVGDVVDKLCCFKLGSEGDVVVEVCKGLAPADDVSL